MFCKYCGSEIEQPANFCANCGAKLIISEPESSTEENTSQTDDEYFEITEYAGVYFDSDMSVRAEIQSVFEAQAADIRDNFKKYLNDKITNFDDLHGIAWDAFNACLQQSFELGMKLLLQLNFDLYDMDMFKQECFDYFEGRQGMDYIKYYLQDRDDVEAFVEELQQKRNAQRGSRGHWVGGGFGIKGAIVGSVKAGMLNMGTNALRGIGDSLTDAGDKKRVQRYKDELYKIGDSRRYLWQALYLLSCDVGECVYYILTKAGVIDSYEFSPVNMVEAKANNIYDYYCQGKYTKEEAIKKLCECIQLNPFHFHPFRNIYKIDVSTKDNLLALGDYLGMTVGILSWMKAVDEGRF